MANLEKVIKGLECCILRDPDDHARCSQCPYGGNCVNRLKMDALELLKAQEAGWISVKERLPDKNGQYLCWFGKNMGAKGTAIATYLEMWQAFGSLESLEMYPNVTHWMPLTEPPKEEDNA